MFSGQISQQQWPEYDEQKCIEQTIEIAVQINGKVRSRVTIPADSTAVRHFGRKGG